MPEPQTPPAARFKTLDDVAKWMLKAVQETNCLYQYQVVETILEWGERDWVYYTELRMLAIDRRILYRFKKISPNVPSG